MFPPPWTWRVSFYGFWGIVRLEHQSIQSDLKFINRSKPGLLRTSTSSPSCFFKVLVSVFEDVLVFRSWSPVVSDQTSSKGLRTETRILKIQEGDVQPSPGQNYSWTIKRFIQFFQKSTRKPWKVKAGRGWLQ